MAKPVISVVVSAFNSEITLPQTIDSILNQSFKDFELIISDDGSTDNTRNIIEKYAQQDDRIIKVYNNHTGYISKVINNGFKRARGRYYSTVDSDDYIREDCFQLTLDFIKKNNRTGMIYTDHVMIDKNNNILGVGNRCKVKYSKTVLLLNFIVFHFRLFHRDLFYRVGGMDESLYRAVDYDFCLKASEIAHISQLKEVLYFYRHHEKQVTSVDNPEQVKCTFIAINNALKRRGIDKKYNLICQKAKRNNKVIAQYILVKKGGVYVF